MANRRRLCIQNSSRTACLGVEVRLSDIDGTEHITRDGMDAVLIDYAAHTAAARTAS